jgi:hypothetical protein
MSSPSMKRKEGVETAAAAAGEAAAGVAAAAGAAAAGVAAAAKSAATEARLASVRAERGIPLHPGSAPRRGTAPTRDKH